MNLKTTFSYFSSEPKYFLKQIITRPLYKLNEKFSPLLNNYSLPPHRVLIALTSNCPLRCVMCCLWGKEGLAKKEKPNFFNQNLNFNLAKKLIKDLAIYKTNIIFTGGEPLIYPYLEEILNYTHNFNLRIFLASGGMNLKEKAEIIKSYVTHLQLSIDGPKAEIHDKSRGVKGSFAQAVEGLITLNNLKAKQKSKLPFINICCTISDINYKYLTHLVNFLASLNCEIEEIAFQHLEFTTRESTQKQKQIFKNNFNLKTNFWEGFLYSPQNIKYKMLLQQIKKVKTKKLKNIKRIVFRPDLKVNEIIPYYEQKIIPYRFYKKCLAPWYEAFILPNGDVWTCADFIAGNLKKNSFLNLEQ